MSDVINVNLGQILDINTQCKAGGSTSNDLEHVKALLEDTANLISLGNGRAYRKLEELIDEIDDNIRGIINNVEDLGTACGNYYEKMIDLGVPTGSIDDNMFVSGDLHDLKKKYKNSGYQSDISDAKSTMRTVNNNAHLTLGDGLIVDRAKVKNFNSSVETYCDWVIPKLSDLENILEDAYNKLEDLEDFKSHEYNEAVNIGAKIAVGVGIAVATTAVATVLLPEAACAAAVIATETALTAAGTAVVSGAKSYHNGSNAKEATVEGTVDGIKAGVTSATIGSVTTVGKAKAGSAWSKVKGNTVAEKSMDDIFFKDQVNEISKNEVKYGTGKIKKVITKDNIKLVVGTGGKTVINEEVINPTKDHIKDEFDKLEEEVRGTNLYDSFQEELQDLGIYIGEDGIWDDM